VFFSGAAYQKLQSAEKDIPSAAAWTVRRWCLDCAAGPEKSSTSEVQWLFMSMLCI